MVALGRCEYVMNADTTLALHGYLFYYNLNWMWLAINSQGKTVPLLWVFGPRVPIALKIEIADHACFNAGCDF